MAGRSVSLKLETEIPPDDPLVVEVRRCAAALERLADKFDPIPDHSALTLGVPVPE